MTVNQRGFEPISVEMQKNQIHKDGEVVRLPLRGTKTSAGYDFYTPVDLVIKPQDKLLFWTDVKAKMKQGEVLLLDIRSSMGVKNDLMLANTIGVVDADYYDNKDNEGNIGICLRNLKPSIELQYHAFARLDMYTSEEVKNEEDGSTDYELETNYEKLKEATLVNMDFTIPVIKDLEEENTVYIKAGERVAQGFFVNYLESENCNSDGERIGGIGSSGK